MSDLKACPSCNTKFGRFFEVNRIIDSESLELINSILGTDKSHLCSACAQPLIQDVRGLIKSVSTLAEQEVTEGMSRMPVATIHVPPKWLFDVLGIV
jgi:hypothetical protein